MNKLNLFKSDTFTEKYYEFINENRDREIESLNDLVLLANAGVDTTFAVVSEKLHEELKVKRSKADIKEVMKTLKEYSKKSFVIGQLNEISFGLKEGLSVEIYAKKEFNELQMFFIRRGLEEGLDASIYAKPCFNYSQMVKILLGLRKCIDVTSYARPEIPSDEMEKIFAHLCMEKYLEQK